MFDVSFSELMVIAVVALIVIGPEKLPKVARTLGALMGRMQRYIAQVKDEVNREVRFEELQKLQQEIQQGVQGAQQEIQIASNKLQDEFRIDLQSNSFISTKETPTLLVDTQKPIKKTRAGKVANKPLAVDATVSDS